MSDVYEWYPTDLSRKCVFTNSAGVEYEEFTCLYPFLQYTLTPWEKTFDPVPGRDWIVKNQFFVVWPLLLYGVGIVAGRKYFDSRPAWNLRTALAAWNFGLSAFSLWGLSRLLPVFLHNYSHFTWRENFCFDPEMNVGSGTTGLPSQLFVVSKIFELIDTFFIVVHKKPLIFLHWYHHISVLLFCWQGYTMNPPTALIFAVMNYAVHSVMYFYYFLMAVRMKPKWFNAKWITIAQILQMVGGVTVTAMGSYLLFVEKPQGCIMNVTYHLVPNFIMYGSYLYLFVLFFLGRYSVGVSQAEKSDKKKKVA